MNLRKIVIATDSFKESMSPKEVWFSNTRWFQENIS